MAKNNKVEISLEEKLKQALVPVDEQPYTIPSNWVWTRLGEIGEYKKGPFGSSLTKSMFVEKGIINQALMKISLKDNIEKSYYLQYFDYFLKEESKEKSKGTAMKNIPPFKVFKEFPFPLPPLNEQKRIVEKLDFLFEKTKRAKEIIEEIKVD